MSPNELRRGSYQVSEQTPLFPFAKWNIATRVADNQSGFLLQVSGAKDSNGDSTRLGNHLEVAGSHLQPLEVETVDEQVLVFSALPSGRCLADQLKPGQTLSPSRTCKLGIAVAQSLALLHQRSIVHGNVRPDRVWTGKKGQVILLRDPASDPAEQGRSCAADWLTSQDLPHQFAAPEFADANQVSDQATDLYSLGCTLFRLLRGRGPVQADAWDQAIAQHAQCSPPELVAALQQGNAGDPLLRVIAHAMAKNRQARFSSADQIIVALRAALPTAGETVQVAPAAKSTTSEKIAHPQTTPERSIRQQSRRKAKRRQQHFIVAGVAAAALLLLFGVITRLSGTADSEDHAEPAWNSTPAVDSTVNHAVSVATANQELNGYRLIDNDQFLYVPPYAADSPPVSLALLPPGPAAIASFRPGFLTDGTDGDTIGDVFKAELSALLETIAKRSGVPIESIERCTIAFHPGKGDRLKTSLAVQLATPLPIASLTEKLQVFASPTDDGLSIYASDDADRDAYFFEVTDDQSVANFAVASVPMITEVADLGGGEINLARNFQSLWNHASEDSDFVAMSTANFLFADGRSLLESSIPIAREPLKAFLFPSVSAGLVVAKFDQQNMYAEVRLSPAGGASDVSLVKAWNEQVAAWPKWADQFVLESQPGPSWRLLATRLPLMMRFVADQTRVGTSDGAAVVNLYLPRRVLPQLGVSLAMAINTQRTNVSTTAGPNPKNPLTLEQMLDRNISVGFDQESLELAIDTVVGEFRRSLPDGSELPPVRIIGADLQKMGITQNQQIRQFAKQQTPLRSVLTDLVIQANPDRTASGPADPKQALVWVIADDPRNPGNLAILVTTRAASEGKYDLPREFLAP